jgi:hypothetical protein
MNLPFFAIGSSAIGIIFYTATGSTQGVCFDGVQPVRLHAPLRRVYSNTHLTRRPTSSSPMDRDTIPRIERAIGESVHACLAGTSLPAPTVALAVLSRGQIVSLHLEFGRISFDARCLSGHLRAIRIAAPNLGRSRHSHNCSWEHFSLSFDLFPDAQQSDDSNSTTPLQQDRERRLAFMRTTHPSGATESAVISSSNAQPPARRRAFGGAP